MNKDEYFMEQAFALAKRAIPEDEEIHPKVGAILARNGEILIGASRNENERGSHAEYLVFKKAKEKGIDVKGATLYTTLEPCTHRHPDFIPCSKRIVNEEIARVVIGMIDPNPKVEYQGITLLKQSGVNIVDSILEKKIKQLNSAFIEKHKQYSDFKLLESVIVDYKSEYPVAINLLTKHLQTAREKLILKPNDIDHYKEIVSYEEFLGLIDDLNNKGDVVRAFLFSLEKQDELFYYSKYCLPYTFHTTQVGSTIVGFGSDSPKEIITGLLHDLREDLFTPSDEISKELIRCGFTKEGCKDLIKDLKLLDRHMYSFYKSYIERSSKYYRGLLSSPTAFKTKAADVMMNMKRWLMHKDYLIKEKPHLIGKYFYESSKHLTEEALRDIAPEIHYRVERIRQIITKNFSKKEKKKVIKASECFGKEVQKYFSEMLYN